MSGHAVMGLVSEELMATAKKLDSIGLRIGTENKDIIRMAANCMGQGLTSYLVSTALDKAKKDIVEHKEMQAMLLSDRDFSKVETELENSSKPDGLSFLPRSEGNILSTSGLHWIVRFECYNKLKVIFN